MITTLILSALLSIQDPLNDAFGDGSLLPPSSINHVAAALDLASFTVVNEKTLSFELEFASLANPYDRELGFSFPIIELYIQDDDLDSGHTKMLEGSGMFLPRNSYWNYAIKLSGDKAELFQAVDGSIISLGSPAIFIEGNKLSINTTISRPSAMTSYGIVGYYSPFSATGWQNIAQTSSPWSYSSTTQSLPVVDVIASTSDMQNQALASGVLPAIASSSAPNYWSYVMLFGLFIGILGLAMRFRFQRSTATPSANEPNAIPAQASPNQKPQRNQKSVENDAFDSFLNSPNSTQKSALASVSKEAILAANPETNKQIKAATINNEMPKTAKAILDSVKDIQLLLSDSELAEQEKQAETPTEHMAEETLEPKEKTSHSQLFTEDDWSDDSDDVWDTKA